MIKKLFKYVGQYKWLAIITPVLVLIEAACEILVPMIMSNLIDKGIDKGDMSMIVHYGIILLALAVAALVAGVAAGITAPFAASGFAKNLRNAMYDHVQDFSFSNIDKFSTGSIVTRMTTDVSNIQMAFQMMIRIVVRAPGVLIFAILAAFRTNKVVSLVFVGVIPVLAIGLYLINSKVSPIFDRVFKTYDKLNGVVRENLHAERVVKSFNRQKHENSKFKNISEKIFGDFSKAEKTMAFMMPLMMFCMYACMILICWIGARLIVASGNNEALGFTTGQMMSMITYTMQILMSLMMISFIMVMSTMAIASGKRIVEILDEVPDISNPDIDHIKGTPYMEVEDGSIDFNHVSRGKILSDIDVHIKSGQTVGIIGGTGSGKSSLVQLIPRLYDVTEGEVLVGGKNVRDYNLEVLRDAVAMVLQKNVLFSGTIKDNLRWGNAHATDEEMIHACKVACADEFINEMEKGYDTWIEQGGKNVSGGQRQRLCIARALLKSPKVLILDDSTSAVDMNTDAKIRKALSEEMPDVTKIVIAQRIASVQDMDVIIVLDDGKISAVGNHDELIKTSPIYREVYESQNKGGEKNA